MGSGCWVREIYNRHTFAYLLRISGETMSVKIVKFTHFYFFFL